MESFSAASARRALGGLESLRWTGDSAGFSNVRTVYAGRTGICGNGLCEVRPGCSPVPKCDICLNTCWRPYVVGRDLWLSKSMLAAHLTFNQ